MIDLGLVAQARKAVQAKPRKFVTVPMLLAVVIQESHGISVFVDTKPGSTYSLNVNDAVKHKIRDHQGTLIQVVPTGLKESEIRQAITIQEKIGDWPVPKSLWGQKAKFRFEYGYWKKYGAMEKIKRFRMSCSWGLVQFMGANIVGKLEGAEADLFIQRFAADIPLQLLYGAGMLDDLLFKAAGDLDHAYRGYNSGDINSSNLTVTGRAAQVVRLCQEFQNNPLIER